MELRQKAAIGVFWSGTQVWGGKVISLVVLAILARLLAPDVFGLVALASIFVAFAQTFLDQGFGDAIVQRQSIEDEHIDTAFWSNVVVGLLIALATVVLSGLIAGLFREPRLAPIIRWLSLVFVIGGLTVTQQAILRRKLAFKELGIASLIGAIAGGLVGVAMALLGYGVWSLVAQVLVSAATGALVLWKVSSWRPHPRFSERHFRELLPFGISIMGTNLMNFVNRHADDVLIGFFLGPIALGFYTLAYRLLLVLTDLLTRATTAVAFPTFSRLQGNRRELRSAFYKATRYTSLISVPAFLGVAILAPEIVEGLFGDQWEPSVPVLRILAFIGILHSVFYYNTAVMLAAGKPSWKFGITSLNAVGNVVAFAIAVRWGIVAVAAAYVIRGYVLSPVPLLALKRLIDVSIRDYVRQFSVTFFGSIVMAVVVVGVRQLLGSGFGAFTVITLSTLAGVGVYFLAIQLLAPSISEQLRDLVRLAVPKIRTRKA